MDKDTQEAYEQVADFAGLWVIAMERSISADDDSPEAEIFEGMGISMFFATKGALVRLNELLNKDVKAGEQGREGHEGVSRPRT